MKILIIKLFESIYEISLIYNINKDNKIKLFDRKFIENNKNNCFLLLNNKIMNILEYYFINEEIKERYLKLKIIQKNTINNMSNMFSDCSSLLSLSGLSKWNINKVNNMSRMFYNCYSLNSLQDISNLRTNNVEDISYMFYNCSSLLSLPDISKWNTNNIKNMENLCYNCESLLSLPDISKWNTNKVTDMDFMFEECDNLLNIF